MHADDSPVSSEAQDQGRKAFSSTRAAGSSAGERARASTLILLSGVLAACVAFGLGEVFYNVIPPKNVLQDISGNKVMIPNQATQLVASTQNGAINFGISVVCLAGFLGAAGGIAQGSRASMIKAASAGSIVGFAVVAGFCLVVMPFFLQAKYDYFEYDLAISIAMHALLWGLVGASAGLALSFGLGRARFLLSAILTGAIAAVAASLLFQIVGASLFSPEAETDQPVSAYWLARLLSQGLLALLPAALLAVVSKAGGKRGAGRRISA